MKKFPQFFQDDTGAYSATRLAFLLWSEGLFCIWAYLSVTTATLAALPQTVVDLNFVFMAGKLAHAVQESSTNNTSPSP